MNGNGSLLSPDPLRDDLRSMVARLAGGAGFSDVQDVFATGLVKSIDLLELVVAIEDGYGVTIDERDVFQGRLRTVERLAALVAERTARPR